jgi:DNA-binding transcriptional LysR family regulator
MMPKAKQLAQLSDIDIRLLRVFRAVVEAGGLSSAELELNIGRSTISRHLKDLETRLGATLCRRGRAGFSLTDEGRSVYAATLHLLSAIDQFKGAVNDMHKQMRGNISIALLDKMVTNPNCHIDKALRDFDDIAPDVTFEMYVEPLNEIEKGVMDGRFQLGIIPMHRTSSSLEYHHLFDERVSLYCGAHHPLFERSPAEIEGVDIMACKYAGLGYHSPNMETSTAHKLVRHSTGYNQEAIAAMILSGRYLGYLPDHYAAPIAEEGRLKRLGGEEFQYDCDFSAIIRRSPKASQIVATFLECLVNAHPA